MLNTVWETQVSGSLQISKAVSLQCLRHDLQLQMLKEEIKPSPETDFPELKIDLPRNDLGMEDNTEWFSVLGELGPKEAQGWGGCCLQINYEVTVWLNEIQTHQRSSCKKPRRPIKSQAASCAIRREREPLIWRKRGTLSPSVEIVETETKKDQMLFNHFGESQFKHHFPRVSKHVTTHHGIHVV